MTEYTQSRASTKRAATLSSRAPAKVRAGNPPGSSALSATQPAPPMVEPGARTAAGTVPDTLFARVETLKSENKKLKERLSEVRARSKELLEVNKELKSRFSSAGGDARRSGAGPRAAELPETVHRSLLEMKEIMDSIQKMKFPFHAVPAEEVKSAEGPAESERRLPCETELDDPILKRLEELQKRYHLPMPVVQKVQIELLSVRAQRTQAMELVREMHRLLSALGEERVRLAERLSRTSEVLNKILEGLGG